MNVYERTVETPQEHAVDTEALLAGGSTVYFQSRNLRDTVAGLLNQRGVKLRRVATQGTVLHPEYVQDYVGTVETGFGNGQYTTYWGKLYGIMAIRDVVDA